MVKRKSTKDELQSMGEITLAKPDFAQALSFAEAASKPEAVQPEAAQNPVAQSVNEQPPLPQAAKAERSVTASKRARVDLPAHPAIRPTQWATMLMPQDAATRKVLEQRALAIAKPASQQLHETRAQYLRFRLGSSERYGIPYEYLEELLYVGNLARVPCTPAFVAGVVNHRGELLTILDLKQFFRMPIVAQGAEGRIIVVKNAGMRIGLLVDSVDGNEEYQDIELSPPLSSNGVSNMEYVLGIHAGNVTLLNLKALLEDQALQVNR